MIRAFWEAAGHDGRMHRERRAGDRWFDIAFLVGFAFKAVDGLVELLVGLPLFFVSPAQVDAAARLVTAGELREDPDDLLAHLIRHGVADLSGQATVFAAVYLVLHGLVKLGIVAAIVSGSRKLYPWAIAALSAFVVWQGYEFALHPSAGLALLTLVDIAIVALTVREYRHHRSLRDAVRSVLGRRSSPPGPAASRRGRQHPEEGVR